MKKVIAFIGILLVVLILSLIAIPFFFQDHIKELVKQTINNHVTADVNFADVNLSFIKSFPKASVNITELSIINKAPFDGDTLVYVENIGLKMALTDAFKKDAETINLNEIIIDKAHVAIKIDTLGRSNYDIAKNKTVPTEEIETESGGFGFKIDHYELNDTKISYHDLGSKTLFTIHDFDHSGNGKVSGDHMAINTKTDGSFSLVIDKDHYLEGHHIDLLANLDLDLKNSKYTFLENELHINQLPLTFDGFVQLHEKDTEVDITFKTPSSNFKNFLAVLPSAYAKNLDGVKTAGDFEIKGMVKGVVNDVNIPKMDIQITSNNASFKYPDLPKGVADISIATFIKNDSGFLKDTYVNIDHLNFRIDQDKFAVKGNLKNVTENMKVNMTANGTLNLANIDKCYPVELDQKLVGLLKADLTTKFDQNSLDTEQYQNVESSGTASLSNFSYNAPDMPNEVKIDNATVNFTPQVIKLDQMTATTGKSDMTASGQIDNLMGFLFSKHDLIGNFDVKSKVFAVSDFMVGGDSDSEEDTTSKEDALKIPSFLDATLNFDAKKVFYDNLVMNNTTGTVIIKDETATLKNVKTNMFDGVIAFDGNVSTKTEKPTFDMALDMTKVDIAQSFASLDLIKGLAPIAQALTGALSTKLNLSGFLNDDMTPKLNSVKGNALANLLNAKVDSKRTPFIASLDQKLNFINLDNLNLKELKTKLNFEDGKIKVAPFDFMLKDIKFTASGSHGFDLNMNHSVQMQVPAKYLGNQVGGLLSQLSAQEQKNMTVNMPLGISGNFKKPKLNLNMKQAVGELTQQIVATQKDKLKGKVKNEVKTRVSEQLGGKGKELLSGLLGNSKSTTDTTATNKATGKNNLKDAAKDVLGGLFGKKKK